MSRVVEDRAVAMEFDNARFERNISQTLSSLDKLQKSLDFSNSKRGFADIERAASQFSLHGIGDAVEGVSKKFLALSTVAVATLATITSHAVTAGGRILKSLSLDPVMSGFHEYETNMTSIQTILSNTASKGTKLTDVNAALDQLNHYADQTIYSFSQMAKNIGTFTAAGVDLDTSTQSIKGIANLAALSGSSADQASSAMYQLSQAIASGSVKLMDWNSIVNAGMGGEVFQKALFESGKAMKTLKGIPMDQTFDQWKKAGNSFRGSLESGWLTSEVLTKTLSGFTGDLTEAQILSMGYTKAQAAEMMKLGKIGKDAATQVKTLTQLLSTVKEAVGSGWSESFRIVFGDFEEAKKLFTDISNGIGNFVKHSAEARNNLLAGWKQLGGRTILIQAFSDAIKNIGKILKPIKEAFREFFPAMTAQRLLEITKTFARLLNVFKIGVQTASEIKRAFRGLFAAIEIGWTVIKEIVKLIGGLIGELGPGNFGKSLQFAAEVGDRLVALHKSLVTYGNLHDFFYALGDAIRHPMKYIDEIREKLEKFFKGIPGFEGASSGLEITFGRLEQRFGSFNTAVDKVHGAWDRLFSVFEKVKDVLDKVWNVLGKWFSELGAKLAAAWAPGDFDAAVDAVNVGLLGGILLVLKKFLKNGLKIDFNDGLIDKIKGALDGVTQQLKAMQTDLKAKTLMKIAGAIAILAASILVLSLIDSEALKKALTAMAVGFAQLVAVMKLMEGISSDAKSAGRMAVLSGAMILISSAMLVLSAAVKNLSGLSWEEIAKGLSAITGMLVIMVTASNSISANTAGMISAGIAMVGIASALLIMSYAVKNFAVMSWEEMAQGLVGVAGALAAMVIAVNLMPVDSTIAAGLAMIPLATGLAIVAGVVKIFSMMSWESMAQGLVGVAGALVVIALAMNLMPLSLPITAVGLLIVAGALNVLAAALLIIGHMKPQKFAQAIAGLASIMVLLAFGLDAMAGALPGAAALLVASGALMILAGVLKTLGGMNLKELAIGLGAIAAVLTVLGIAGFVLQPVVPALMGLGVAIGLIGIGFALFGVGAMAVAKSLEVLAKSGVAGTKALVEMIKILIAMGPIIFAALAKAVVQFFTELLASVGLIVKVLGVVFGHILDTIILLAPKIGEALIAIITAGLKLMNEKAPEFIAVGFAILIHFMKGIRDNIYQITTVAVDILVNFIKALGDNAWKLTNAAADFIIKFLNGLAKTIDEKYEEIEKAGIKVGEAILNGITGGLYGKAKKLADDTVAVVKKAVDAVKDFLGIHSPSKRFFGIGENMIAGMRVAFDRDVTAQRSAVSMATRVNNAFRETLGQIPGSLSGMGDFNPVISPVLDLSRVRTAAGGLNGLMSVSPITPDVSLNQARIISSATGQDDAGNIIDTKTASTEISFTQINNSPASLTTNDIYRNTKSQLALAKEKLEI